MEGDRLPKALVNGVQWVPEVAKAGGKSYTFHYEAAGESVTAVESVANT